MKSDPPSLTRSRNLRARQTKAENKLWFFLRSRRLSGHKFRRQYAVGPYFIDFYCVELRLGIELDGGGHQFGEQKKYDENRSSYLSSQNIEIIRFWNNDFLVKTDNVLAVIFKRLNSVPNLRLNTCPPHPSPLPEWRGDPCLNNCPPHPSPLPEGRGDLRSDNCPPHPNPLPEGRGDRRLIGTNHA